MNKITLQNVSKSKNIPNTKQFKKWLDHLLSRHKKNCEVVIRLVDNEEIVALNKKYRKKNKPTNIIAFQFETPQGVTTNYLGDIVICIPVVKQEAKIQHKTFNIHLAHLVIHGTLHLLGYDHKTKKMTEEMETLEIKYLKKLGIANPY